MIVYHLKESVPRLLQNIPSDLNRTPKVLIFYLYLIFPEYLSFYLFPDTSNGESFVLTHFLYQTEWWLYSMSEILTLFKLIGSRYHKLLTHNVRDPSPIRKVGHPCRQDRSVITTNMYTEIRRHFRWSLKFRSGLYRLGVCPLSENLSRPRQISVGSITSEDRYESHVVWEA